MCMPESSPKNNVRVDSENQRLSTLAMVSILAEFPRASVSSLPSSLVGTNMDLGTQSEPMVLSVPKATS